MKKIYILLLSSIIILSIILIIIGKDVFIKEYNIQPPAILSINDVDIKPVYVTDAYVDMNITAYINHDGGSTNHAYMLIRAIDSNTKLLVNQTSASIPETDVRKTLIINKNIIIDRDKDYEFRISLFDNGSIIDTGSLNIKGLSALIPKSKESGIVLKNIDFSVGGVSDGRVNIIPYIYLENIGSTKSDNLTLILKFIQADSNLLADMTNVNTGEIDSEHTTIIETANITVPDGYNYNAVIELWKDSIYINEWEKPLMLAPTKTMPKGTTEKQVNIEVSNFVRQGISPGATLVPGAIPTPVQTPREPGFDIFIGIIAILFVLILRKQYLWRP